MSKISIERVDLSDREQTEALLELLDAYARDPMGLNEPLGEEVRERLIPELKKVPGTLCLLARVDGKPAGIANCFYGFSTFYAKKLINIHDLAVSPDFRGKGVGGALLKAVEERAAETGCCRVTLEVREDNRARNLYERFGYEYGEPTMFFMTKELE